MKYILFRFFPLVPGAAVVFQDYFYHWSATLISNVQLLVDKGFLSLRKSRASALEARALKAFAASDILDLDLQMNDEPDAERIDAATAAAKGLEFDRPEMFLPRLYLAKLQLLWERGRYREARKAFIAMVNAGSGTMNVTVLTDFLELMEHGFDMRRLYERDH